MSARKLAHAKWQRDNAKKLNNLYIQYMDEYRKEIKELKFRISELEQEVCNG